MTQLAMPRSITRRVQNSVTSESAMESRSDEIYNALTSGETVHTQDEEHNFKDVIEYLYNNVDDNDELDRCIIGLAFAKTPDERDFLLEKLNKLISRAATEYTAEILPQVTAKALDGEMDLAADYLIEQHINDRDYHHL